MARLRLVNKLCDQRIMLLRPECPNCGEPLPGRLALFGAGSTLRCEGCDCSLQTPRSSWRVTLIGLVVMWFGISNRDGGFPIFLLTMSALAIGI